MNFRTSEVINHAKNQKNNRIQDQVDIMKTTESSKIRNRHLMVQAFEQGTPNTPNCLNISNLATLSPKLYPQSPQECYKSPKTISKQWNQTQNRLFTECWLQKIIENPYQNFSFDVPLNRKSYNKSVSSYIKSRGLELNINCQKSPEQCKSKFGAIRRKIQRERKKVGDKGQFGFIDFIIQQARNYVAQDYRIQAKIQKVRQLRQNQSPFVNITFEEYAFLKRQPFKETFDLLLNFLEKNKKQGTLK